MSHTETHIPYHHLCLQNSCKYHFSTPATQHSITSAHLPLNTASLQHTCHSTQHHFSTPATQHSISSHIDQGWILTDELILILWNRKITNSNQSSTLRWHANSFCFTISIFHGWHCNYFHKSEDCSNKYRNWFCFEFLNFLQAITHRGKRYEHISKFSHNIILYLVSAIVASDSKFVNGDFSVKNSLKSSRFHTAHR
jgi:hypothetical protein